MTDATWKSGNDLERAMMAVIVEDFVKAGDFEHLERLAQELKQYCGRDLLAELIEALDDTTGKSRA